MDVNLKIILNSISGIVVLVFGLGAMAVGGGTTPFLLGIIGFALFSVLIELIELNKKLDRYVKNSDKNDIKPEKQD